MARKKPAEVVAANTVEGFDARAVVEQHAAVLEDHETRLREIVEQLSGLLGRLNHIENAWAERMTHGPVLSAPTSEPESPVEALDARVTTLEAACAVQLGKHAKHAQAGAQAVEPPAGE